MARRSKVLRTLKQLADKYNLEFVGETTKGHFKWQHRTNGRICYSGSDFGSFHSYKNTEQTMRMIANGQYANEN